MLPKILILTVTYDGKDYCYKPFADSIKKLSYPKKCYHHLWVDNSKDNLYAKKLRKDGHHVHRVGRGNNARESVARAQEYGRRYAIKNGYDYVFSLESDIMPPQDIIQELLKDAKDIVGALYLIGKADYKVPCVTVQEKNPISGLHGTRVLRPEEFNKYYNNGLQQVAHCGLGCTLIKTTVLEQIVFHYFPDLRGYSDIYFANDVNALGYRIFLDTHILVPHHSENSCDVSDR